VGVGLAVEVPPPVVLLPHAASAMAEATKTPRVGSRLFIACPPVLCRFDLNPAWDRQPPFDITLVGQKVALLLRDGEDFAARMALRIRLDFRGGESIVGHEESSSGASRVEPDGLKEAEMAEAGTKVSTDQKIQVVRDAFAAFMRGDLKGLSDTWSDDFTWHARGSIFGGDFKGKEAALGAIARYPQALEDIKLDFHDIMANDKHVVALVNSSFKRGGKTYEDQIVYIFHINDQAKATEAWIIADTELAKKAVEG
jgi:ketosteroid isomerase-like protein